MRMSSTVKILLGALATAVLAWFLHGPFGFGQKCAVQGQAAVPAATAPAVPSPATAPVAEAPAAETPAAEAAPETPAAEEAKGEDEAPQA